MAETEAVCALTHSPQVCVCVSLAGSCQRSLSCAELQLSTLQMLVRSLSTLSAQPLPPLARYTPNRSLATTTCCPATSSSCKTLAALTRPPQTCLAASCSLIMSE